MTGAIPRRADYRRSGAGRRPGLWRAKALWCP